MLKDKTAVVTGASSGIGQAIATALAEQEVKLHLLGRDRDKLDALRQNLGSTNYEAKIYAFDMTNDDALRAFTDTVDSVDILVHSAGVVKLAPLAQASVDDLDWHYQVNLRAPYLMTQLFLDKLSTSQGDIVFVNSGAGLNANANWSQYAASKFALRAVADSLRAEVQDKGVRVLSVYPGRTASPMQAQVKEMEGQPYKADTLIQPEDIASQIVAVLSLPRTASVIDLNIRPGS